MGDEEQMWEWRWRTKVEDERWDERWESRWEMRDESYRSILRRASFVNARRVLDSDSWWKAMEGRRFPYTHVHTRACAYRCVHTLHTLGAYYTYTRRAHYVRARFLLNDFIKVWLKFNSDFNRNFSSVKTWYELLKFN